MAANAKGVCRPARIFTDFPYTIILAKMGQKRPKNDNQYFLFHERSRDIYFFLLRANSFLALRAASREIYLLTDRPL